MRRVSLLVGGLVVAGMVMVGLALAASPALATVVDFSCSVSNPLQQCNDGVSGTVTKSGSNFSTTGISVWNSLPFSAASPFDLTFNTATSAISLTGTGANFGDDATGTIGSVTSTSASKTLTLLSLEDITWTSLTPGVAWGGPVGDGVGIDIYKKANGASQSVDVTVNSTPEPSTLLFFGTGILGLTSTMFGVRRRRAADLMSA